MDVNNFRAAAYLKNSEKKDNDNSEAKSSNLSSSSMYPGFNNSSSKTVQGSGQILRGGTGEKVVKPASFRKINLSNNTADKNNSSFVNREVPQQKADNAWQNFDRNLNSSRKAGAVNNTRKNKSQELENATDYLKSGGLLKVPVEKPSPDGKDSVYRKVAKFLVLIGGDEAAKILPHLSEKQVDRIIPEIASIRTVNKDEAAVIFEEFNSLLKRVRNQGGVETAKEMLVKAYGRERAEEMLKKAVPAANIVPFEYLQNLDKERIYLLLKDENVGVQALVLSYLNPQLSAGVIGLMKYEDKTAVILRLAKMTPVSPEILRRVDQGMREKAENLNIEETENIDGRNALAQILKKMDLRSENEILSNLSDDDPDLERDLRSRLFTIDDVVNADDRFIQKELRSLTDVDIVYLIAGKSDDFRNKILNNISINRRNEVLEQYDIINVKRRSDCDKVTNAFISKLRLAFEDGDLIIKNRNDELFV